MYIKQVNKQTWINITYINSIEISKNVSINIDFNYVWKNNLLIIFIVKKLLSHKFDLIKFL